jgi:phosphoglycolate phosphatase-like HAD superfamily hydrolase
MANNISKLEKIKAVALDFDGVVTSLDIDWKAAIRQASDIVGCDIKSLILFYEKNFDTLIFQKVSSEMEKIELEAIKKAPVLPYVKEALQKLKEKKVQTYIVTMQSYRVAKEFLDQHELDKYFNGIISREQCSSKKVQVEFLINKIRFSPNQVLLVDDSKRNINLCSELGITCFLFQSGKRSKEIWDKVLKLIN